MKTNKNGAGNGGEICRKNGRENGRKNGRENVRKNVRGGGANSNLDNLQKRDNAENFVPRAAIASKNRAQNFGKNAAQNFGANLPNSNFNQNCGENFGENLVKNRAQNRAQNEGKTHAKSPAQSPATAHFGRILRGKFKGAKVALPRTAATRPTKSIVLGSLIDSLLGALRGGVFVEGFGGSGLLAANAVSAGAARAFAVECSPAAFGVTAANAARFGFGAVFGDTFVETPRLLARLAGELRGENCAKNSPNSNLAAGAARNFAPNFAQNGENFSQIPAQNGESAAQNFVNFAPNSAQNAVRNPAQIPAQNAVQNGENSAQHPAIPAPKIILYLDPPFSIRAGFAGVYERCAQLVRGSQDALDVVVFEHDSAVALGEKIGDFTLVRARKFGRTTLSFYEKTEGEK